MSKQDVITAYTHVAFPEAQEQDIPGLEKKFKPGVEYSKLEVWDKDGKPSLVEYTGSGKLQGKYALITGSDSGIGRAVAIFFAREGCAGITIAHLPEEREDAKEAKADVEASGAKVNLVAGDLMREENCKALVDSHLKVFGQLDVLVNNASKQIMCDKFEDIPLDQVRSTFQSNILQMFAVTKFALPHLKRGASIINTTSVTAYQGHPKLIDYSSTKGAILSFTRALATQLAPRGIRVNAVAPGPVVTVLQAASRTAEDMKDWGLGLPLYGRAAQPAEIAGTYVFLGSGKAGSGVVTGQVVHVNSGTFIGGS